MRNTVRKFSFYFGLAGALSGVVIYSYIASFWPDQKPVKPEQFAPLWWAYLALSALVLSSPVFFGIHIAMQKKYIRLSFVTKYMFWIIGAFMVTVVLIGSGDFRHAFGGGLLVTFLILCISWIIGFIADRKSA